MKYRLVAEMLALSMIAAIYTPVTQMSVQAQPSSESLTDEEVARGGYSDLQIAVVRAESEVQSAENIVKAKEYALEDAQEGGAEARDAEEQAHEAYNNAVTAANTAAANVKAAEQKVPVAEDAIAQAETIKTEADSKVEAVEAEIPLLQQAVSNAEARLAEVEEEIQDDVDAAQAVIDLGMAGFLKEQIDAGMTDAQTAYDILVNKKKIYLRSSYYPADWQALYDATDVGAENDATSLDNVKAAIELINESSKTRREQDGRNAYSVNHVMMVIGELNANWCYNGTNSVGSYHSGVFNVAENIADGFGDAASTVDAWYDSEKESFINAGATKDDTADNEYGYSYTEEQMTAAGTVGHFLNMVNSNLNIVGAGAVVTTKYYSSHPVTRWKSALEMSRNRSYNAGGAGCYDINTYATLFNTYYDKAYAALEKAKAPLKDPQAELDAANDALDAGNQRVEDAKAEQRKAQTELNKAESSLQSAQYDISVCQNRKNAADKTVADKKNAWNAAIENVEAAEQAVEVAEQELKAAEQDLEDKKAALEAAQKALDNYQSGGSGSGSGSGDSGSGSSSDSGNDGSNSGSASTGPGTGTDSSNAGSTETGYTGWKMDNGKDYWYEEGVKQGTTGRGKEIYDPDSDAWYWLDAVQGGAKAVSKDVYQESSGGKWVRYDADGHMVKGWDTNEKGSYYFDRITGAMTKGWTEINGKTFYSDPNTGIMAEGKVTIDGIPCWFGDYGGMSYVWEQVNGQDYYWYEDGKRQGYDPKDKSYRGKEIYDPAQNAWFWLDNNAKGKKAVSKDVYQPYTIQGKDDIGKWVRYDSTGRMVKGWQTTDAGTYYFDPTTGAMAKGQQNIDGKIYQFDEQTGILQ